MKSTWSDEESEGSQEEDELVSNQVVLSSSLILDDYVFMQGHSGVSTDSVCLSAKTVSVALENKSITKSEYGSEFASGDESKKDDESLHEAYKKMYAQWLKVWTSIRALNSEIHVLRDLNEKAKGKISELETLLAEKSETLKTVTSEQERTQKSLRLLNNGSSKLDHWITTGKSFGDHSGSSYKGESSSYKTIFINSGCLMIH